MEYMINIQLTLPLPPSYEGGGGIRFSDGSAGSATNPSLGLICRHLFVSDPGTLFLALVQHPRLADEHLSPAFRRSHRLTLDIHRANRARLIAIVRVRHDRGLQIVLTHKSVIHERLRLGNHA